MKDQPVAELVQRIRRVPDRYRTFTEGAEEVAAIHKIPADLLREMLDLGLPCRASGSGYYFDRTDLENAGLSLRLPCPRYVAMQWWARSLGATETNEQNEFSIKITAKCPQPGHPGPCTFGPSPYVESAAVPGSISVATAGLVTARVRLTTGNIIFDGAFAELFDHLGGLTFHIFPEAMPVVSWMAHETGLADCRVAAQLLVQGAAESGLAARPAAGFFMAPPFPMHHVWTEFKRAGTWIPADPFLLQSLERWGIVDGRQWPVYRSPAGLLWKLRQADSIGTPLVLHAGQASPSSCAIRRMLSTAWSGRPAARPGFISFCLRDQRFGQRELLLSTDGDG